MKPATANGNKAGQNKIETHSRQILLPRERTGCRCEGGRKVFVMEKPRAIPVSSGNEKTAANHTVSRNRKRKTTRL